ncbi:uncharacterized protein METZ01_LOCUS503159, partial [marine metagenome]
VHVKTLIYNAMQMKFKAEIIQAKATLRIYFDNPVGIGEHPQHLEEIDRLIGVIVSAESKLTTLQKHFEHQMVDI